MSEKKVTPLKFKGELRWASVPPNPARKLPKPRKGEENDTRYSVQVECTPDLYKKIIKAGADRKWELREDLDKDGNKVSDKTFVNIGCAKIKGEYEFDDPWVIDKNQHPFREAIGNGSVGIVIAELVVTKDTAGIRLKGVQVLEHVPYEGGNSPDKYKDMLEGDSEAEVLSEDDEDEAPFDPDEVDTNF